MRPVETPPRPSTRADAPVRRSSSRLPRLLDEAAQWVEYLNRVDLNTLRTAQLSPALARPFRAVMHRERLQQFVRGLVQCPGENAPVPGGSGRKNLVHGAAE